MQFSDIKYDEDGIISFYVEGIVGRKYNPFLIAYQAMVGDSILEDYKLEDFNLIPRYIPICYLEEAEITSEMRVAMKWLIENCVKEQEKYYWLYNYPVLYKKQKLDRGWKSAFGQAYVALAMILFWNKTKKVIYREHALGAIRGLITRIEDGGCAEEIGNEKLWFEELPGENATHIFNAHLISIIAINEVRKSLKVTEFDLSLIQALNAFKYKVEWMDTGINSAYDMPSTIDFQLQVDSENFCDIYMGEIFLEDGTKKSVIDLRVNECFEQNDCYASGVDWGDEFNEAGFRKIVDGRKIRNEELPAGSIQNTYLNFTNIDAKEKVLKFTINYSVKKDIKLILKKNCGKEGFKKIGFNNEIILYANKMKKEIFIPTRCFYEELSMVYHLYHVELMEEILNIQFDRLISNTLNNFVKYINQENVFDIEPKLTSLLVHLKTQDCLEIEDKEPYLCKEKIRENSDSENRKFDRKLLAKRCKEADANLRTIYIMGTEPTLYKELPILIDDLKKIGKQVFVVTNGINLRDMLSTIIRAGVDKILISLDGPGYLHDKIRGKAGLFQEIMSVIQVNYEEIIEARKHGFDIVACCAITPMNYLCLNEMVEELASNGIRDIWCTHMNYVDAEVAKVHNMCHPNYLIGQSCIHEEMNPKKVNPWLMYQSIQKAKNKAKSLKMNFIEAPNVSSVEEYTNLYHRPERAVGQKVCQAPFRTMQINADGSACVMSRCYQMEMGNIKNSSLIELFYSEDIVNLRKEIIENEQWDPCKRCCAIM